MSILQPYSRDGYEHRWPAVPPGAVWDRGGAMSAPVEGGVPGKQKQQRITNLLACRYWGTSDAIVLHPSETNYTQVGQ